MDAQQQRQIFTSLARQDKVLASLSKRHLPLTFYNKKPKPAFHTLISMIISQQLSNKAAATIERRLLQAQGGRVFSAQKLSEIKDLRSLGLSQQKQKYIGGLIEAVLFGDLNFRRLKTQSNEDVRRQLMLFSGVGPWTADVFLLANFHRIDIFPAGDLILQKTLQKYYALPSNSKLSDYAEYALRWQPYRSLLSLLFWKAANFDL